MLFREIRCTQCSKLLFKATPTTGTICIKCPRCRHYNQIK